MELFSFWVWPRLRYSSYRYSVDQRTGVIQLDRQVPHCYVSLRVVKAQPESNLATSRAKEVELQHLVQIGGRHLIRCWVSSYPADAHVNAGLADYAGYTSNGP